MTTATIRREERLREADIRETAFDLKMATHRAGDFEDHIDTDKLREFLFARLTRIAGKERAEEIRSEIAQH